MSVRAAVIASAKAGAARKAGIGPGIAAVKKAREGFHRAGYVEKQKLIVIEGEPKIGRPKNGRTNVRYFMSEVAREGIRLEALVAGARPSEWLEVLGVRLFNKHTA